jgi:hypothetical protein
MPTFHTPDEAIKEFDRMFRGRIRLYFNTPERSALWTKQTAIDIENNIKKFLSLVWQSAEEARNRELAEKVEALKVREQTYPSELDDVVSLINK